MSIKEITKSDFSRNCELWNEKIIIPGASTSDDYILPITDITSIGISWDTGTPTMQFTFNSRTDINGASAQWVTWDGSSIINVAATAIRITNSGGGDIELIISIRGRNIRG